MVRHYSDTDSGIEIASSGMSARKRWERHRHLSDCVQRNEGKKTQAINTHKAIKALSSGGRAG